MAAKTPLGGQNPTQTPPNYVQSARREFRGRRPETPREAGVDLTVIALWLGRLRRQSTAFYGSGYAGLGPSKYVWLTRFAIEHGLE